MGAILKLENICKYYYSNNTVSLGLNKINLEFHLGEFVAITGESGSGKTTLLNVIAGLDTYEDGELYYNGENTSHFDENDWENFEKFTAKFGSTHQVVADDNVCTNPKLVRKAIKDKLCNSILIKLNQIGTITETLETIRLARKNNMTTMVSHRSGETGDTFIADFTVATNAGQLKSGAPARSERVEKYNRLLEIENQIGVENERLNHFPNNVDFD